MPFAGYADFGDCVRKNQDKENPAAYCATIQRTAEGGRSHRYRTQEEQTSAQRGAEDAKRYYQGEGNRRASAERRRGGSVPNFLNRRRGDRRSTNA